MWTATSSIEFSVEELEKVYLERNWDCNRQINLRVADQFWYWNVRFYRVLQEEEYQIRVSPSGQIAGYTHKLPEAKAGATLHKPTLNPCGRFFHEEIGQGSKRMELSAGRSQLQKKPNRMDWDFTWEKHG